MVQLAANPDDLSFMPRTRMVEGKNWLSIGVLHSSSPKQTSIKVNIKI